MKLQTILFIAWCFQYHVNSEILEIKVPQQVLNWVAKSDRCKQDNIHQSCELFSTDCQVHGLWSKSFVRMCPVTCGLCTGVYHLDSSEFGECEDKHPTCPYFGQDCYTPGSRFGAENWPFLAQCPGTCGLCKDVVRPPVRHLRLGRCDDRYPLCPKYAHICSSDPYQRRQCPRTCGTCDVGDYPSTGRQYWQLPGPQIPPRGRQVSRTIGQQDQPTGRYWWGGPQIPPYHTDRQHNEDQPTGRYWWGGPQIPPYHTDRQHNEGIADEEQKPAGKWGHCIPCGFSWCCSSG